MASPQRQVSRGLPDVQDRLRAEVDRSWLASSLAGWMSEHRDQFDQLLRSGLTWDGAAAHFAYAGLRDAGDKAPSAMTAAETWRRVTASRQKAA